MTTMMIAKIYLMYILIILIDLIIHISINFDFAQL